MARRIMKPEQDELILEIEERLTRTLRPIRPSRDVVQRLRERIRFPAPEEIRSRLQDWKQMFLVFGGVMSGLLVMITVARAFFYLVKRHV
jgi:hypothetical protein